MDHVVCDAYRVQQRCNKIVSRCGCKDEED